MAIIVKEEHLGINWPGIVSWVVVIFIGLAGIYYVFFNNPEVSPMATPGVFKNTEQLSKIKIDPNQVTNSSEYQNLKQFSGMTLNDSLIGRQNPFVSY